LDLGGINILKIALIALALFAQQPATPQPGQLVSAMLAKYSAAQTLAGTVKLTVTAGGQSAALDSQVQFQRPNLFFLRQIQATPQRREWLVVADGKEFSYPMPVDLIVDPSERLRESMRMVDRVTREVRLLDIRDVYAAASRSIKDRSAPLDIAVGRTEDLRFLSHQWATLRYVGRRELRGRTVHVVGGDWREYDTAPVNGAYEIWITDDHQIVRYVLQGDVAPAASGQAQAFRTLGIWDVDFQIDAKPDPALFTLPR
jgi:hypothetical protein